MTVPVTVAERTREAVRDRPFLYDALAADVVNYTAAARLLNLDADQEAVAAALRRYADDVTRDTPEGSARVTMHTGVGVADDAAGEGRDGDAPLVAAGGVALTEGGDLTAVLARGEVSAGALEAVLGRCRTDEIAVVAAGLAGEALVVAVPARDGAAALRVVEAVL